MKHIRLIHIAPQLPPNIGGVADYAVILGRRVEEQTEGHMQSSYIQAGSKGGKAPDASLSHKDLSGQSSPDALVKAVEAFAGKTSKACVLLHYVGYGYQQRGCPWWLLQALRQLRREHPGVQLITMFHELHATSWKPWESAFWTTPLQRHITAEIAQLSDGVMTNREASAQWLRAQVNGQPIRVSPVFSNVGEPETVLPYEKREPYAVVFGGADRKAAMYRHYSEALEKVLQRVGVEKIVDIGTSPPADAFAALELPVETVGILPAEGISAYLQRVALGVLQYPLDCLTKSGVMAAYAAHGVPPIVIAERQTAKMLQEGKHFVLLDALAADALGANRCASMSRAVKQWYDEQGHSRRAALEAVLMLKTQDSSNYD